MLIMEAPKSALESLFFAIQIRAYSQLDTTSLHLNRLLTSCNNGGIKIFTSSTGITIGYVAWANVSRETLNMVDRKKAMPTYLYEWNDGKIVLIYDVVFLKEWAATARIYFFDFLRGRRFFTFFKNDKITICINKYTKYNGKYWKYKKLNTKKFKLMK